MPAGYETTSTAISYALYEIARNPLVQQKLQEELDMLGCDREPSFDDLSSFPYAEAVFLEGMRLHPPVTPFIALVSTPALLLLPESPLLPSCADLHQSVIAVYCDVAIDVNTRMCIICWCTTVCMINSNLSINTSVCS